MPNMTPALRALTAAAALALAASAVAQDTEFIRALERAQAARPATVGSSARIAPESEPGIPLVIHGRLFGQDGKTPLADAVVFAYHTDREGLYDRQGSPPHSWRLKGWAKTDAAGNFEFRTIRPASYPSTKIAQHVHFTILTQAARYHAGELQFDDDPFMTADRRAASSRDGEFAEVQKVRMEGSTAHVDFRIRLNPSQKF
jgi:protocatechuate 3,4-dioxygenase beta subunit